MQKETFKLIHRAYEQSVEQSGNIIEILENLQRLLSDISDSDIPDEDVAQFDTFLKGVYTSKMTRRQTFNLTNLVSDITFVIMYITVYLNDTQKKHIDINLNVRRKALETELSKILYKSKFNNTANIHDRFGLRGIILNPSPEDKDLLFFLSDYVITLLIRKNKKEYDLFLEWITHNKDIDDYTRLKIQFILDLPFKVYRYKNYVDDPKSSTGYQSIHYVMALEMFSPLLPGAELELQWRTKSMHKISSEDDYEDTRREEEDAVFTLKDFSKINMVGFTGYDSIEDDMDGVHFSKLVLNRRISSTLV